VIIAFTEKSTPKTSWNTSLRGTKEMNRYYVFVVNVICYTYTYTHKEYSEAVETLNSVINAMPKDLLPVKGCILNDDMEVIMSRFESGEQDGMDQGKGA
jgi:hypothetical protein